MQVTLTADEMSAAREVITMQLSGTGLKDVEVFSKSDPFLEISRATEGGPYLPVFKTEVRVGRMLGMHVCMPPPLAPSSPTLLHHPLWLASPPTAVFAPPACQAACKPPCRPVKDNNLNPIWAPFTVKATQLNNGDPYRSLRLRVYDYEANGAHRLLGEATTSAVKLKELVDGGDLGLLDKAGKPAGSLQVRRQDEGAGRVQGSLRGMEAVCGC
eukprot:364197-Chlamydomonas_euryale.AAC.42